MDENKPYYSAEWQDNQRMDVLFSPFRENREINPQSWDSKMKFWKEMILQDSRYSKTPIVNPKLMPHKFIRNGKRPVCLDMVLNDLYSQGKLQNIDAFCASLNAGWASWGMDLLVKRPLTWTFNKMIGRNSAIDVNTEYILPDMLTEQAEVVLEHHYRTAENDTTDHLIEYKEFAKQMEGICPDPKNLDLILMVLGKENKVSISSIGPEPHERVIRFAKKNKRCATPVSEIDLRILRLQKAEDHLQNQVLQISDEMERCRDDARIYLKKGLRNSAKNALKRKKTLEKILNKRETALENIHVLIQRIKDAESDKMILDAYADGTNAFKQLTAASGLNVDHIDDVMTDLQDVFDIQNEINASIAQGPVDPMLDMSMADLDSELQDILESDSTANTEEDTSRAFSTLSVTDKDLPSVPTFDPSTLPHPSPTSPRPQQHVQPEYMEPL